MSQATPSFQPPPPPPPPPQQQQQQTQQTQQQQQQEQDEKGEQEDLAALMQVMTKYHSLPPAERERLSPVFAGVCICMY